MVDLEHARNGLLLGRYLEFGPDTDRTLRRAVTSGVLERVRPGVFRAPQPLQRAASARERAEAARHEYLERVASVVLTRTRMPVLSHAAALAVWNLPRSRRWPDVVDVVVGAASSARSKNGVRVHRESYRDEDIVELDGYLVTTPARTGIDLARAGDFTGAIAALDAVLGERRPAGTLSVGADDLVACLADVTSKRGRRIAERAIAFADGRSGSVGESEARVVMHKPGFPQPELQLRHRSSRAGHCFTDFEWPNHRVIGEFDGLGKYQNGTPARRGSGSSRLRGEAARGRPARGGQ